MKHTLVFLSFLFALNYQAFGASPPSIKEWKTIQAPKKFGLYNYIIRESGCNDSTLTEIEVWDYHVAEFKKKNPHITNVNKIEINETLVLQVCDSSIKKEEVIDPVIVSKNEPITKEVIQVEDKKDKAQDKTRIILLVGTASENDLNSNVCGIGFESQLFSRLNYKMDLINTKMATYFDNKISWGLSNNSDLLPYFYLGMGKRNGQEKQQDLRYTNRSDNYISSGIGLKFNYNQKTYFNISAGSNWNRYVSPTISVEGWRNLGDVSLGVFVNFRSTKGPYDEAKEDRQVFSSGLMLGF